MTILLQQNVLKVKEQQENWPQDKDQIQSSVMKSSQDKNKAKDLTVKSFIKIPEKFKVVPNWELQVDKNCGSGFCLMK